MSAVSLETITLFDVLSTLFTIITLPLPTVPPFSGRVIVTFPALALTRVTSLSAVLLDVTVSIVLLSFISVILLSFTAAVTLVPALTVKSTVELSY